MLLWIYFEPSKEETDIFLNKEDITKKKWKSIYLVSLLRENELQMILP